ncbi:hypothetical protein HK104_004858, partial [Borealophlyctis nickersoniae]
MSSTFLPASNYSDADLHECLSFLPDGTCQCPPDMMKYDARRCQDIHAVEINWPEEITFCVAVMMIGAALYRLQRFIKEYAYSLIDRQNQVQRLSRQNADLQSQLKS